MRVTQWLIGILCVIFSVTWTQGGGRTPEIDVQSSDVARIYNVRIEKNQEDGWQIRGRVTRTLSDRKVPQGQIITEVYNPKGISLYTLRSDYIPRFVHRKKKRASYFTVQLPDKLDLKNSQLRLYYLSNVRGESNVTSETELP